LIRYCKEGVHLFGNYYALWDGYYTLYNQKVYPVIHVDNRWYIFQKQQDLTTKRWEGGTATRLTPTVFRLNPDLNPFEGDLLQTKVIRPIEEELDLLAEQVHEAPKEEPEPEPCQAESDSNASIPEKPKRMSAVTITPTQSTIATALTSCSGPPPRLGRPQGRLVEAEEEAEEEVRPNQPPSNQQEPLMEMENWRAKNLPSSPEIELELTNSCTNSSSTNSSTPMPQS
jgi:hypothetical protein